MLASSRITLLAWIREKFIKGSYATLALTDILDSITVVVDVYTATRHIRVSELVSVMSARPEWISRLQARLPSRVQLVSPRSGADPGSMRKDECKFGVIQEAHRRRTFYRARKAAIAARRR